MADSCNPIDVLTARVCAGDDQALAQVFDHHRPRLRNMVKLRVTVHRFRR